MTDDELLKALRETVRAEEGALRAAKQDLPVNDDAFLDRMTDFSLRELSAVSVLGSAQSHAAPTPIAEPRRQRRKATWLWPLAAALAVLFVLIRSEPDAPLARYRVEIVQGSERSTRDTGEVQNSLALRADLPFELTLRPASQTQGPLGAEVYLRQGQGLSVVPIHVEVTPLGVLHVRGKLPHNLAPNAQDSSLLVNVGRPDALPKPSELKAHKEMQPSSSFQAFRIEIRARPP